MPVWVNVYYVFFCSTLFSAFIIHVGAYTEHQREEIQAGVTMTLEPEQRQSKLCFGVQSFTNILYQVV